MTGGTHVVGPSGIATSEAGPTVAMNVATSEGHVSTIMETSEVGPNISAALMLQRYEALIASRCRRWQVLGMEHGDLVSEASIAALSALDTWDPTKASLGTWVCRFVDRSLAAAKRKATSRPPTVPLDREPLDPTDPAQVAVEKIAGETLLERCLAHLGDPRDQAIVELLAEGKTQADIAATFGLTAQAINQRVLRIRAHLEKFV